MFVIYENYLRRHSLHIPSKGSSHLTSSDSRYTKSNDDLTDVSRCRKQAEDDVAIILGTPRRKGVDSDIAQVTPEGAASMVSPIYAFLDGSRRPSWTFKGGEYLLPKKSNVSTPNCVPNDNRSLPRRHSSPSDLNLSSDETSDEEIAELQRANVPELPLSHEMQDRLDFNSKTMRDKLSNLGRFFKDLKIFKDDYQESLSLRLSSLGTPRDNLDMIVRPKEDDVPVVLPPSLDMSSLNLLTIPYILTSQFQHVHELDLSANDLTTLSSLVQMTELKLLDVSHNKITSIPDQINRLTQLKYFFLDNNQIPELCPEIGGLTSLNALSIKNNQLSDLPSTFTNLSQLLFLDLSMNCFDVVPPEIKSLKHSLQELKLSDNNIGSFETDFPLTDMKKLILLELCGNSIHYFSALSAREMVHSLKNIVVLDLDRNQLTQLPSGLWRLQHIRYLKFDKGNPQLMAHIPHDCLLESPKQISAGVYTSINLRATLKYLRELEHSREKDLLQRDPRDDLTAGPAASYRSDYAQIKRSPTPKPKLKKKKPFPKSEEFSIDMMSSSMDISFFLGLQSNSTKLSRYHAMDDVIHNPGLGDQKQRAWTVTFPETPRIKQSSDPIVQTDRPILRRHSKVRHPKKLRSNSGTGVGYGYSKNTEKSWFAAVDDDMQNIILFCSDWEVGDTLPASHYQKKSRRKTSGKRRKGKKPESGLRKSGRKRPSKKEKFLRRYPLEHEPDYVAFYKKYFHPHSCTHLIAFDLQKGPAVVSILQEPAPGTKCYWFMLRTQYGVELGALDERYVHSRKKYTLPGTVPSTPKSLIREFKNLVSRQSDINNIKRRDSGHNRFKRWNTKKSSDKFSFKAIRPDSEEHANLHDELVALEESQLIAAHKIGVLYVANGQMRETEFFNNCDVSPALAKFLPLLGQKIPLKDWRGYSGGLDTSKYASDGEYTIYTQWRKLDLIFHVCPFLSHSKTDIQQIETRKRHIGNDVVVLVFIESEEVPFSPFSVTSTYVNIFIVVCPVRDKSNPDKVVGYRVNVARRKGIPQFGPFIDPARVWKRSEEFRQCLLAKMVNAERAVYASESSLLASRVRRMRSCCLMDTLGVYLGETVEAERKSSISSTSSQDRFWHFEDHSAVFSDEALFAQMKMPKWVDY